MTIDRKEMGAAIKRIRNVRGLSQVELAKLAGLSKSGNSVALIERGERSVSLDTLNALADALEVPPECITILGSSHIEGSDEATELMTSLQELVTAIIIAQAEIEAERVAKEEVKKTRGEHVFSRLEELSKKKDYFVTLYDKVFLMSEAKSGKKGKGAKVKSS